MWGGFFLPISIFFNECGEKKACVGRNILDVGKWRTPCTNSIISSMAWNCALSSEGGYAYARDVIMNIVL